MTKIFKMTCTGSQGFLVNLPAMNRRIIIFVVSMMGFALLGLLSIQVYWIRNSIQMKEAAFTTGVTEAVSGAVMTLDRIQSARRLRNFKESARLYRKVDSLNFLIDKRYQELTGEKPETGKTPKRKNGRAPVDPESRGWRTLVQLDSTLKQGSPTQEQKDTTITDEAPPQKKRKPTPDVEKDSRMQRLNKQRQRILDELMRRSYLYDAALQGFEAESRILPLEKRIDPGLLDSLLGAGLEAKGIRTAFEFGVFDPTRDSLVIEKTGDYSQELLTRGFAINLFPSGSKSNPAYLAVYFPNETRFVLSQIWWMLLVSGLFILVIVVLFYQTVSTIIHQKKLSDMKNDFINNMTHEFKTPISTISLVCEALRDHEVVQSPEMAMNYIGIISEENKRLGLMAEKILQASVLEKGQLHMKSESVDMHEVIRSVVQNAGLQAESRNGHLTFTQGASHSLVTGDRLHLTNVILNLVDNAIKYSPHSPEVRLNTSVTGHFLKIDCADNGIGISKRDQVRIFEKLYRVPTGNLHDVKGFGLGLSYVKAVVEAHHGQISVQSEPRRGSVFTILLPLPPETSLD